MRDKKTIRPNHIGLAWIDKNSYYYRNETLTEHVKYTFEGEPCMSIDITPRGTLLTEYYRNMKIGCTTGINLEEAVFHHYARYDLFRSPIYAEWKRKITNLGNIHVDNICKNNLRFLHFPSIYLLSLQIPIVKGKKDPIMLFRETLEKSNIKSKIIQAKRVIFYPEKSEEEKIELLSIVTPIAMSTIISKLAVNAGVIGEEKLNRAIITPLEIKEGYSVMSFDGSPGDSFTSYSIIFNQ
jgi:hypothetical protein